MSSVNKVILVGNLGRAPESRELRDGGKVANLRVATSERWRDKSSGEMQERTEWHSVVIWPDNIVTAMMKYATKGTKVYVEGQLETRKWQDKNGVERYATEVVVRAYGGAVRILSGGREREDDAGERRASSAGSSKPASQGSSSPANDLDDEIPF